MGDNFKGLENINESYVRRWTSVAKKIMGNKENVTIQEAKDLFSKLKIEIDDSFLEKVAKSDNQNGLSTKEFASIFAMLDGKKQGDYDDLFHFDGIAEDRDDADYHPERSIVGAWMSNKNKNERVVNYVIDWFINLPENENNK